MSRLRPPQVTLKNGIFQAWADPAVRNVLATSPTGTGKTVLFADIVRTMKCATAVIAHRGELVSQMALALAREGVPHRIVGPDSLRKNCVSVQMAELGRSLHDANAKVAACGVDTLVGKKIANDPWFHQVGFWVCDEAHHLLRENKWGESVEKFPNARGLGVTAFAGRADRKGLGAGPDNDGVFHALVRGPHMRDSINQGYLTDYRVFAPPSDVDYSDVTVTASGELSPAKLRAAVHESDAFVGDVVKNYKRICMEVLGRLGLGITFAVDIDSAKELCLAYRAAGVPAEIVTSNTPDLLRIQILQRFKRGEVMQLVNVDLFGEGFDLPAIEVVSMGRKTESFQLFTQQFGRALRIMVDPVHIPLWGDYSDDQRLAVIAASRKRFAIVIDHVGNVIRHGLPDAPRETSLLRYAARSTTSSDAIPLRVCANPNADGMGTPCSSVYPRYQKVCPFCNFYPVPVQRTAPEFVDGDLHELDTATLQAMRGEVGRIDGPALIPGHLDQFAARAVQNMHFARQQAQATLRQSMSQWAGFHHAAGRSDSEIFHIFYFTFGIDTLGAQVLGRPEAEGLTERIAASIIRQGATV